MARTAWKQVCLQPSGRIQGRSDRLQTLSSEVAVDVAVTDLEDQWEFDWDVGETGRAAYGESHTRAVDTNLREGLHMAYQEKRDRVEILVDRNVDWAEEIDMETKDVVESTAGVADVAEAAVGI